MVEYLGFEWRVRGWEVWLAGLGGLGMEGNEGRRALFDFGLAETLVCVNHIGG